VGGHRPIVWSGKSDDKNNNIIKYIVAFGGRLSIILHTTINQKQTPATCNGGEYGEDVRPVGRYGQSAIATFGGIKI
jgi:hypothetical protein